MSEDEVECVSFSEADMSVWCFYTEHPISIAQCRCLDVENKRRLRSVTLAYGQQSAYMLGEFPCTRAEVVGLCVGVDIREKRIVYYGERSRRQGL